MLDMMTKALHPKVEQKAYEDRRNAMMTRLYKDLPSDMHMRQMVLKSRSRRRL